MTTQVEKSTTETSKASVAGTGGKELRTSQGVTTIADTVVQKIAAVATRDVTGVYDLGGGGGAAKAFSVIRERIPGSSSISGQGVSVEVGERQAAIDLDLVVEFGATIPELSKAVRRNVISSVERMTGLEVTEVNVTVNDVHLPSDDKPDEPARVQ